MFVEVSLRCQERKTRTPYSPSVRLLTTNDENRYHWSFLVGPKAETSGVTGWLYHAKERAKIGGGSEWYFEARETSFTPTAMILVRVLVAKIEDGGKLLDTMKSTPIRQDQQGWNCVHWIKETLATLQNQQGKKALGTGVVDWPTVRNSVMTYCQRKKAEHRFDGKGNYDTSKVPTFDLIERKEIVP